jgi:hypothetical protein
MAISITLAKSADPLSNSGTSLAEGVLSAANVVIGLNTTSHPHLTAFVTGVVVSEARDGALIFENGSVGSVFLTNASSLGLTTIKNASGAIQSSLTVAVSALGNACALGAQVLTYTLALSSKALSGDGSTSVVVDVSPTTATTTTVVTAVNTPYGGRVCRAEFARLRNLEII